MNDSAVVIPPFSIEETAVLDSGNEDAKSTQEAKQLSSGKTEVELRREAAVREAGRTEKFRDHFEFLAVATLYFSWIIFAILGITWVYHLVALPSWYHLPEEQLKQIHAIITGGILAGIAGGHMKKRLD